MSVLRWLVSAVIALALSTQVQAYTFTSFDVPGAVNTTALGMNNARTVVGTADDGTGPIGFIRSAGGSFTTFTDPLGLTFFGINNVGKIVGTTSNLGLIRDSGGVITTFSAPDPSTLITTPRAINDAGAIVGSFLVGGSTLGFLRDSGGNFTTIDLGGLTEALGNNNAGQIVGSVVDPTGVHGFFGDIIGGFATFDVVPAGLPLTTSALDINNHGEIVGGFVDPTMFTFRGFVRDIFGNFTFVDVPGATATVVAAITDAGDIAGSYFDANGNLHGFISNQQSTNVPEPSTLLLLLTGLGGLALVARRKGRK